MSKRSEGGIPSPYPSINIQYPLPGLTTFLLRANSADSSTIWMEEEAAATGSQMAEDGDDDDGDYQPADWRLQRSRSSSEGQMVHISLPKRELLKSTSQVSARCKLSHRQSVAFTATLVKAGGGTLSDVTLSKSSSHRHRSSQIDDTYSDIKSRFKENVSEYVVIHWDSKVIKYAHHEKNDERLAVVASFPSADRRAQFLGAPQLADGSGSSMAAALQATLEVWDVENSSIIGLSWDTTSANTGAVKGSSTLLERELGSARLWLACRHHVAELHVKHVDQEIRGTSTGKFLARVCPSFPTWHPMFLCPIEKSRPFPSV